MPHWWRSSATAWSEPQLEAMADQVTHGPAGNGATADQRRSDQEPTTIRRSPLGNWFLIHCGRRSLGINGAHLYYFGEQLTKL